MTGWPFLTGEGLSGTGKTVLAREHARLLDGICVATPVEPYRLIRAEVDAVAVPAQRSSFYVTALAAAGRRIANLRETRPVICEGCTSQRRGPSAAAW